MSRHIDYSEAGEPTRWTSLESGGGLQPPEGHEYEQNDPPPLTPRDKRELLYFIKINHAKWGGKWQYGLQCEEEYLEAYPMKWDRGR